MSQPMLSKLLLWVSITLASASCSDNSSHDLEEIIEKSNDSHGKATVDWFDEVNKLVNRNCISCHGAGSPDGDFESLLTPNDWIQSGRIVPGNPTSSSLFLRLINNSKPMPPSGNLSAYDIVIFRNWINNVSPDKFSFKRVAQPAVQRQRLMTRSYVVSVLKSVFGESEAYTKIEGDEVAFGGSCDWYNPNDCENSATKIAKMGAIPELTPMRQGLMKQVCRTLIDNESSLNAAIGKTSGPSIARRISIAYGLFFPGQNLPPQVLGYPDKTSGSLISLFELSSALEDNEAKKERVGMGAVLYALCQAPEWHIP